MLKKIRINGFKCFDNEEILLKNFTLLTGVNSSGKSSLIQSILFLLQQKEKGQNPLNGKYVRLGLIQDIRNTIMNSKTIEIAVENETGDVCKVCLDTGGKCEIKNDEILCDVDFVYLSAERVGAEDVYQQNLTDEYRIGHASLPETGKESTGSAPRP